MKHQAISTLCWLALASACMPDPPARDAGDPAYVRQVVPLLLGRPPINQHEATFFNDVVQGRTSPSEGRLALVRGLMRSDEFAEQWSDFLLRHANVDRERSTLQSCFDQPMQAPSALIGVALSATRMNEDAETGPINGADVLSSVFASRRSDVSPFLRVNLMTTHAGRADSSNASTLAAGVQQTYLDRQLDCMGCHNSYYATTSSGSGWRRHYPMLGYFEKSLYGAHEGPTREAEVSGLFRLQASAPPVPCAEGTCVDSAQPWASLSRACGDFVASAAVSDAPANVRFGALTGTRANVWDLEDMLRSGVDDMRGRWLSPSVGPGDQLCTNCAIGNFQAVVKDTCMSCHNPERAPSLGVFHFVPGASASALAVQPYSASGSTPAPIPLYGTTTDAERYRGSIAAMVGSGSMPPSELALPDEERDRIEAIVSGAMAPGAGSCRCNGAALGRTVDPNKAFAFLTGANLVNSVWEEAFGRGLTVPNHFPRTQAQGAALEFLTQRFVHEGWSLRSLLERIMLGKFYSRQAPADRAPAELLVAHFEVPPVYDPWSQVDRRRDPNPDAVGRNNAMTEGIRRRPVRTLLHAAHSALGWPSPGRFPGEEAPSLSQQRELGQPLSQTTPGSVDADLQNVLAWEDYTATCRHPNDAADWIDSLIARATGVGASRENTIIALKDRLIGEPYILDGSERSTLNATFGSLSAALSAADEGKLRGLCGVLLKSPQFMLQGLTPNGARAFATPPDMPLACGPERECDYGAFCRAWAPSFSLAGYTLTCPTPALLLEGFRANVDLKLFTGIEGIQSLCTGGSCGFIEDVSADQCGKNGSCLPEGWMACDTRCSGMFCCSVPLQDIDATFAAKRPGLLYSVADQAVVYKASGILRVTKGGSAVKLAPGDTLQAGDILRFTNGAVFQAEGPYGKMATPEKGLSFQTPSKTLDLLIGTIDKVEVDEEEYYGSVQPSTPRQAAFIERVESWTQARIAAREAELNAEIKEEQSKLLNKQLAKEPEVKPTPKLHQQLEMNQKLDPSGKPPVSDALKKLR